MDSVLISLLAYSACTDEMEIITLCPSFGVLISISLGTKSQSIGRFAFNPVRFPTIAVWPTWAKV